MGYSMPLGFLILLALAANGDAQGGKDPTTPHPSDTSPALALPHPTAAANESSQNAATTEKIHTSKENGNNKTSGEVHPPALQPLSEESSAAAKRPPNATKSSPAEKPRAKPGQAEGEEEKRAPPKSVERNPTPTSVKRGQQSTTTPAASCGSGGLTARLGTIMAVVLSLLLCF